MFPCVAYINDLTTTVPMYKYVDDYSYTYSEYVNSVVRRLYRIRLMLPLCGQLETKLKLTEKNRNKW